MLGGERPELGLLVDAVDGLESLEAGGIHPLPEGAAAYREYVRGITDDALLVLAGAAVLRLHHDT